MAKSKGHRAEERLTFAELFARVRRDDHRPTRTERDNRRRDEARTARREAEVDRSDQGL